MKNYLTYNFWKIVFAMCLLLTCKFSNAQNSDDVLKHKMDSLKNSIVHSKNDTIRCNALSLLIELSHLSQTDSITEFYNTLLKNMCGNKMYILGLDSSSKVFYIKKLANTYNDMATLYYNKGDLNKARYYADNGLKLSEVINYANGLISSFNILAGIYQDLANISKSLDYYYKSLKIGESIGDQNVIATTLNNISTLFYSQNQIAKALEYSLKSLHIREKIKNKEAIASSLHTVGSYYSEQGNTKKALEYLFKSLKIKEELKDQKGMSYSLNNIGVIYFHQGNLPEALLYTEKSLKIAEETKDNKLNTLQISTSMSDILLASGKVEKALLYSLRNLALAKELGYAEMIKSNSKMLYAIYKKQNKMDKALEMHELYLAMRDSITNKENDKALYTLELKYETEKKDAEIALLNKDKQLKDVEFKAKLQQQTIIRNVFIGGFLVVLLIALISVFNYRQKLKSTQLLAIKNEEIAKQQALINGQMIERQRIAKELHDGIGGTLASINIRMMSLGNSPTLDSDLNTIIKHLGSACKEIRVISHDLSSPALTADNSFIQAIQNAVQQFHQLNQLQVNFNYFLEDQLNAISKNLQSTIYRLVQELLHNIVKHANATRADVNLSIDDNTVYLIVEDNGIGFDTNTKSTGIGLLNMKSRIADLKGSMTIDTEKNRGTAVTIKLPIASVTSNNNTIV